MGVGIDQTDAGPGAPRQGQLMFSLSTGYAGAPRMPQVPPADAFALACDEWARVARETVASVRAGARDALVLEVRAARLFYARAQALAQARATLARCALLPGDADRSLAADAPLTQRIPICANLLPKS